jgi:hypothetical protein
MAKKSGRITIVSDFTPRDLFDIFLETAGRQGFGLGEADGPLSACATKQYVKRQNFRDIVVAELAILATADRTRKGDGRLTLDWDETKAIWIWGGGGWAEQWIGELTDALEEAIEDDDGEVLSIDED